MPGQGLYLAVPTPKEVVLLKLYVLKRDWHPATIKFCGCLVRTLGVPRSFNKSRRRCYSQDKKKTFIPELEITI